MSWPFPPPIKPMLAKAKETPPAPPGWVYEPKWDGFRAIIWADGDRRRIDSRTGKDLLRYFPELEPAAAELPPGTVVDAEIVVVVDDVTEFETLQQRIHPAASRVNMLAEQTPAELVVFDLLSLGGVDLRKEPQSARRARLDGIAARPGPAVAPDPVDRRPRGRHPLVHRVRGRRLRRHHRQGGRRPLPRGQARLDQVEAPPRGRLRGRRLPGPQGRRQDRLDPARALRRRAGNFSFVGHCSGFSDHDRVELLRRFEQLRTDESFGGDDMARVPGAQSRWSTGKELDWVPVEPGVVVQIGYDQVEGIRFRHATRFERWRPDKPAEECTLDQLQRPEGAGFTDVVASRSGRGPAGSAIAVPVGAGIFGIFVSIADHLAGAGWESSWSSSTTRATPVSRAAARPG